MKLFRTSRPFRASLLAGILAAAIVLTGTLAWRSISQETTNEFATDKNPGGRLHDDFNGTKNKDIYAENFTDVEKGVPVYVRVKLLEYMELGEDAGIRRDVVDGTRKAKPVLAGADINDFNTWHLHKPGETSTQDPFHDYWNWVMGGKTDYLPTFNKNKDSLSVDVNGTYVGTDNDFETGTPYDDYLPHAVGDPATTGDAYYDADSNSVDEYTGAAGTVPGGGGTEKTAANPNGNYVKVNESHDIATTLNGLGVVLMDDWIAAGKPVCNKWVWDDDGWFYWPEPVLPETATGLLLTQVLERTSPAEKSYYAIHVVGQFATAGDWGDPNTAAEGAPSTATGFYVDGVTDEALDLLNQATTVKIGENTKWYLPQGSNLYKEILDDEGKLGKLICAGEDQAIGNTDDRDDVVYVEAGVNVGGKDYGKFFLKPTADEPYYRATTPDGQLGHATDDRLWVITGSFPADAVDKVATGVEITPDAGATIVGGKAEMEVGDSLDFNASVTLDTDPADTQDVVWSVAAADNSSLAAGTKIDANGTLSIDANETASELIVTAKVKLDDRVVDTYNVKVFVPNIQLTMDDGSAVADTIQAGETWNLKAELFLGDHKEDPQPAASDFTWTVGTSTDEGATITNVDGVTATNGALTVAGDGSYAYTAGTNDTLYVKVTCVDAAGNNISVLKKVTVEPPTAITLKIEGKTEPIVYSGILGAGTGPFTMVATVKNGTSEYTSQAVAWSVTGASESDTSISQAGILTVSKKEPRGQLVVKATSKVNNAVVGELNVAVDDRTVTVDSTRFLILKEKGDQVLLLKETCIGNTNCKFSDTNTTKWHENPSIRTSLQSWLNSKPTLASVAIETDILTRSDYDQGDWQTTKDKVFLLSEADVMGTFNRNEQSETVKPKDYTAGEVLFTNNEQRKAYFEGGTSDTSWWLRSPCIGRSDSAAIGVNGDYCYATTRTDATTAAARPAVWVPKSFVDSLLNPGS